jgi:hypothetical protein
VGPKTPDDLFDEAEPTPAQRRRYSTKPPGGAVPMQPFQDHYSGSITNVPVLTKPSPMETFVGWWKIVASFCAGASVVATALYFIATQFFVPRKEFIDEQRLSLQQNNSFNSMAQKCADNQDADHKVIINLQQLINTQITEIAVLKATSRRR